VTPDCAFAVIVEATRYVYLYQRPAPGHARAPQFLCELTRAGDRRQGCELWGCAVLPARGQVTIVLLAFIVVSHIRSSSSPRVTTLVTFTGRVVAGVRAWHRQLVPRHITPNRAVTAVFHMSHKQPE
jgi:hypothetical protein